jgi:hypothetical protein
LPYKNNAIPKTLPTKNIVLQNCPTKNIVQVDTAKVARIAGIARGARIAEATGITLKLPYTKLPYKNIVPVDTAKVARIAEIARSARSARIAEATGTTN